MRSPIGLRSSGVVADAKRGIVGLILYIFIVLRKVHDQTIVLVMLESLKCGQFEATEGSLGKTYTTSVATN